MSTAWDVRLFGSLAIRRDGVLLDACEAGKSQELFCYLLLHRQRQHPREVLADLLWGDASSAQSKKYLRQSLWQLRSFLDNHAASVGSIIILGKSSRVGVNPDADLWLDVADFEEAFRRCEGVPGQTLDEERVHLLRDAVTLYHGDLLEDWYHDWCLYERERLQNMYLTMLDKLVRYCESHREFESGIVYATRILECDRSRERAHRSMMRLQYLIGDRTAALHQFDRCTVALREDLGVEPAKRTVALYEQLRADDLSTVSDSATDSAAVLDSTSSTLDEALSRLEAVRAVLVDIRRQIQQLQQQITSVGRYLSDRS